MVSAGAVGQSEPVPPLPLNGLHWLAYHAPSERVYVYGDSMSESAIDAARVFMHETELTDTGWDDPTQTGTWESVAWRVTLQRVISPASLEIKLYELPAATLVNSWSVPSGNFYLDSRWNDDDGDGVLNVNEPGNPWYDELDPLSDFDGDTFTNWDDCDRDADGWHRLNDADDFDDLVGGDPGQEPPFTGGTWGNGCGPETDNDQLLQAILNEELYQSPFIQRTEKWTSRTATYLSFGQTEIQPGNSYLNFINRAMYETWNQNDPFAPTTYTWFEVLRDMLYDAPSERTAADLLVELTDDSATVVGAVEANTLAVQAMELALGGIEANTAAIALDTSGIENNTASIAVSSSQTAAGIDDVVTSVNAAEDEIELLRTITGPAEPASTLYAELFALRTNVGGDGSGTPTVISQLIGVNSRLGPLPDPNNPDATTVINELMEINSWLAAGLNIDPGELGGEPVFVGTGAGTRSDVPVDEVSSRFGGAFDELGVNPLPDFASMSPGGGAPVWEFLVPDFWAGVPGMQGIGDINFTVDFAVYDGVPRTTVHTLFLGFMTLTGMGMVWGEVKKQ